MHKPLLPGNKILGERKHPQLVLGRFSLDNRKDIFMERVVKHWNELCGDVVQSADLEKFQKRVGWHLRAGFSGDPADAAVDGWI